MSTPERGWSVRLDAPMRSGDARRGVSRGAGQGGTSASTAALLAAWRATRLPSLRFGLLALFVAWAASLGSSFAAPAFIVRWALAFSLIAQFRLWDDLADRARDRSAHPQRVLARIDDVRVFVVACIALGGVNAAALFALHDVARVAGWTLLCIGSGAWYRGHTSRALLHTHVLLLKYPAFVLLLVASPAAPWTIAMAAACVYSALCSFDLLDAHGGRRVHRTALAAHGCVLTFLAFATTFDAIGCIAALLVASMHAVACLGRVGRFRAPGSKYWPFVAAVVVLVVLSVGSQSQ